MRRENMNQVKIKGGCGAESNIAQERKYSHASPSMQTLHVPFYTSMLMWTPVHVYCRSWLSICLCCLFCLSSMSVCMHSCCISHIHWVFLLICLPYLCMDEWDYTCKYIQYLSVHVCVRCECSCVYWPWLAAPAGAPWWPQGSCPAGSAAHTQSEPTSLLCPFLPAATHTPDTYTHTHMYKYMHIHAHTNMYTLYTCVHRNTEAHMRTHIHAWTRTQDRERMAALVGLGSHS